MNWDNRLPVAVGGGLLFGIAVAIGLSGCAMSARNFDAPQQAKASCMRQAKGDSGLGYANGRGNFDNSVAAAFGTAHRYNDCMEASGFHTTDAPQGAHQGALAVQEVPQRAEVPTRVRNTEVCWKLFQAEYGTTMESAQKAAADWQACTGE